MKTTRIRPFLIASVAASLLVTACSSDGDDGGASSEAAETTVAGETTETTAAMTETTVPAEGVVNTVPHVDSDIVGTALKNVVFTTLAGLVVNAGLVEALRGEGPFTVFAPPDAAFTAVPDATMDAVHADKDLLTAVLTYHVVPGEYMAADLEDGAELETLQGGTLTVRRDGDTVFVNDIEVVAADVEATNGVIHVIDGVLVPG